MPTSSSVSKRDGSAVGPNEWKDIRLGDIFEHIVDTGHCEGLPILSVTMGGGIVHRSSLARQSEREVAREKHLRVAPGDIAYNTMRMWQGASGLIREEGYLSPAYTVCRLGSAESAEYWAHCFKSEKMITRFRDYSQGLTGDRLRLYFKHFAAVPTVRPPLPEQRKIAAILSSVDEVIEKTETVIEQLQVVKKATMQELLTRGLPAAHTRLKQTEIGEIPEEWEVSAIGDLFEIQLGKMLNKAAREASDQFPYLGNRNVQWGRFQLDDLKTMGFSSKDREKFCLRPGDLLVCEGGEVGRTAIWQGEMDSCYFQKALHRLRPIGHRMVPAFMLHFMRHAADAGLFSHLTSRSSIAHLTREKLATAKIAVPDVAEQKEIARALDSLADRIKFESATIKALSSVKTSLMSVLLSGAVRVPRDEVAA